MWSSEKTEVCAPLNIMCGKWRNTNELLLLLLLLIKQELKLNKTQHKEYNTVHIFNQKWGELYNNM
jgi:hypothetical protein